jgi:exonuclease SbcC
LEKALAEAEAGEGEAASAWEATASARLRLEVFEAAKGALERLAQARSARLQPSEREGDLERRSQEAQRRSEALSRVLEAHGLAEQALERAQHASSSKEPEIQRARALRQALTAAEAEAGRAATAVRESESARDGAASAFLQAQTHSEAAERARELADAALAAAPHGALAEGFGALEARQSTHREACAAHGRELRALKQREAGLPALQSTYQAAEAAANSSARICEGLESEAEAATRDLALRLEGAADATTARRELESRREALRSRQSGLQALIQHLASQELARKRAEDLDQAVERVEQELAAAQVELHALDARLKEVADSIAAMEDGLLLARWGQGLAEQRGRLQEGVPCPLCGAEDHPAVRDPEHAKRDEEARQSCARLETHLTDQREAQVELTQQLQRAHREVARLESEQDAARGRQEGVWKEVATATQAIEVAAKALEVPPEAPILDRHLEALALDLGRLEEARCHLDESERAHREAQAEAVQARLAHAEARTSLQAAQQRLEEARTRSEEEGQRLAGVGRELDRQREALMAEFLGLGVQAEHLDEALVEARTRVRAFLAAKAQAETAEREWQVALHDLEVARQAQGAAEAEVEARQAERSRRHEELERAQAAASECLEGADPEPIYRALQEAVKGAQEVVKARVAELREAQQDATRAQAAHEEALRRHHEAIQSAANAETELAEALRPHGDEASLEAKAIPPEEAEALVEQRAHLDRTLVRAQATLEAMRRQWETHWAGQPKEADSSVDTPTIQAQLESLGAEIQEHQRTVAQAAMALEAQEEARRRQRDAVLRLQATEAELNLWDRMNRLLGTNEGEAFRRFAQVLNLRDLLAKANARLERLRPRYRLVPAMGSDGSERLAFAVEDAAHAGEIRPVNTLSGGETFLVSLSLALALADYRTVRMPLETLLLDEGFGTLDPQSLAEVLGTLGSLTAQGTQVGIISHVEALQERIPARIRVQPAGLGRSILKVEV